MTVDIKAHIAQLEQFKCWTAQQIEKVKNGSATLPHGEVAEIVIADLENRIAQTDRAIFMLEAETASK